MNVGGGGGGGGGGGEGAFEGAYSNIPQHLHENCTISVIYAQESMTTLIQTI